MSTTVSYKGSTIATLNNETKTLTTAGTWVEGNITVTDTMSGVDIPVFTITFDSEWEEVTSITCNKTFTECLNLYQVEYDGTCPAYVIYTNGNEEYVGSAVGYEADQNIIYFVITPDLHADITYDNLGQINFYSLPSGYPDNITITQNGVYNPTNFDHRPFWNVTVNVSSSTPNLQAKTNINPTESSQTITADSNYDGLSSVQINAISNTYVGSGITRRSSTDLIVSGATVTAPAGYYSRASTSVASGTEGTPTATKGTVSNHQVTVTPSVTNTTGYIEGGTKTGTAVTVTASELASGNKEITQNGTNIDVVGYSTVSVAVPSSSTAIITDTTDTAGGTIRTITTTDEVHLQTKTITPTSTQQTVLPDTGYDGFSSVIVGASSGGSPSATNHEIYFEFSDGTDTTIDVYYDDSLLSTMITAYTPSTYGQKTVTLAELDGVAWYEPMNIPLNTELVDFSKVLTGYVIQDSGAIEATGQSWDAISDYIPIDPSMTFTFKTLKWYNVGFCDSSKNIVRVVAGRYIETSSSNDVSTGTLNSSNIPSTAAYIILSGNAYNLQSTMSLIRTA